MKILILGGTKFVGRHLVDAARTRGHEITLFHRGKTNPELFPDIEHLLGDRDGGLAPLAGRMWDCAIDTCGYVPRLVRASTSILEGCVIHYTFISSLSVYKEFGAPNQDELAPVGTIEDPTTEEITGESYGPLKVLCEHAAEEAFPGGVLNVRCGVIVGPHDPTDRFTYWVDRMARGGDVLAPGRPDAKVQFIDGRDLAAWILDRLEVQTTGTYNVTGPDSPLPLASMLEACRAVGGSEARLHWVSDAFLEAEKVTPWSEMPFYAPDLDQTFDCGRARAIGLRHRPVEEIVRDTLSWLRTRPADHAWKAGIKPEREAELLAKWRLSQA